MQRVDSLRYNVYGWHVLKRDDFTTEKALWIELTQDGRYHLCDANGSIEVQPGDNVDAIVEDWLAHVA